LVEQDAQHHGKEKDKVPEAPTSNKRKLDELNDEEDDLIILPNPDKSKKLKTR